MTEEAKKSKKSVTITFFIMLILVSGFVIFHFAYHYYSTKKELKFVIFELKENHQNELQLNEKLKKCQQELKKNDNNKELIDDINDYIKQNYKTIPRVVRNDISVNIVSESIDNRISPELVVGIVEVESGFNPSAVSSKGARGLMQVMKEWVEKFDLTSEYELHNIDTNIETGIGIFIIHLEEEDGNIEKALYKYVGGDKSYVTKVFVSAGKFVAFRSTNHQPKKDEGVDIDNKPNNIE